MGTRLRPSAQVRDVRFVQHSEETLPKDMFGAPYRHAIDKVSARAEEFQAFVSAQYRDAS